MVAGRVRGERMGRGTERQEETRVHGGRVQIIFREKRGGGGASVAVDDVAGTSPYVQRFTVYRCRVPFLPLTSGSSCLIIIIYAYKHARTRARGPWVRETIHTYL